MSFQGEKSLFQFYCFPVLEAFFSSNNPIGGALKRRNLAKSRSKQSKMKNKRQKMKRGNENK